MDEDFSLAPMQMQVQQAMQELGECSAVSGRYGLRLSKPEMRELVEERARALASAGRIEFGGGILPKLIYAFCDSPYVQPDTWAETLAELQEAFYYFKSESLDRFTDDDLIAFMVKVFNGRAQGSAEYLTGTSLESLCRWARQNWDEHDAGEAGDLF